MPKTIALLHPFTPQAAGVVEKSVAIYHSQPHLKALQLLETNRPYLPDGVFYPVLVPIWLQNPKGGLYILSGGSFMERRP